MMSWATQDWRAAWVCLFFLRAAFGNIEKCARSPSRSGRASALASVLERVDFLQDGSAHDDFDVVEVAQLAPVDLVKGLILEKQVSISKEV